MLAIASNFSPPALLARPYCGGSPFGGRASILVCLLRADVLCRLESMEHPGEDWSDSIAVWLDSGAMAGVTQQMGS